MKKNCCIWFIGIIMLILLPIPIIENPPEEVIDLKYGQFAEVSSTNDDLEDLDNQHNLGYSNSKYWFADSTTSGLIIKSAPSLTGSTSTEHTYSVIGGNTFTMYGQILRSFNTTIIATVYYSEYASGTSSSRVAIYSSYSTDSGDTWTDCGPYDGSWYVRPLEEGYVQDVFLIGTDYYVLFHSEAIAMDTIFLDIKNNTIDTGTIQRFQGCYPGKVIDSEYYYIVREDPVGAENYQLRKYDGTTDSKVEDLTGLTPPGTFNYKVQQYWRQKNQEFMIDEDHFYYRTVGDTTWSSISDAGTTTNGVVWSYDSLKNLHIHWIIWKDSIYKIFAGGGIAKIQTYTGNAYVGWDDWFANGADKIYQLLP